MKNIKESGTRKPITSLDAHMYLKEIKDAFKDEKYKYKVFLRAMKDFNLRRIDIVGVMERVEKLFQRHTELLLKFNNFLPDGFEIKPSPKKPNFPVMNKEDADKYLDKVKTRFQHQPYVYDSFVDIMIMYKNKDKSLEEIYEMIFVQVASLFKDHHDLVDGFTNFLL
ncbi:paired amphipathic helix protein Sin3-like 3 [Vicia villosa]|uniref:paired amphipathic helix protein Sin3-like 3 n=1 Tax=Vicia villosa TaxID=3911 RepID=UPI00273B5D7E|nr:paired amphipathic helix protein Sin3-like 3 [Vicia villosa]